MGQGRVSRSQSWLIGAWVCRVLIGLGITACLGRFLDASAFGFYAFIGTLLLLGHVLIDLGTGAVAAREIARDPDRERPVLEGILGWRWLVATMGALGVVVLGVSEPDGARRGILLAVAGVLCLMPVGLGAVVMQVRQSQALMQTLGVVVQVAVLGGCFLLHTLGVAGALFASLLCFRDVTNLVGTMLIACRRLGYRPRPSLRDRGLPPLLKSAFIQGLAVLVQITYFHIDVLLVRVMRGEAELGAYAAAFRPINPLLLLPGTLMAPVLPVLVATAVKNLKRFREQVVNAAVLLLGIGALGAVAGILAAPELLNVLYDGRYLGGALNAAPAFAWLCAAFFCVFATAPLGTALLAVGREGSLLRIALAGLALNVVGNLLLIPRMGFEAAALTTAATEAFVLACTAATVIRHLGRGGWALPAFAALAPACALALVIFACAPDGITRVAVAVVGGSLGAAMIFLGPTGRAFRRTVDDV